MGNQFDDYGRLTGTADALGQAAKQEFDAANNKQVVTDRRGNRTVYTFDADGNITTVVNALGQTTTFTFDANGNETSVTNALGEKTERTFDGLTGKQLSEKNALGHTTRTAYPTVGTTWQRLNPLSSTDARGNVTGYTYENLTQPGATPSQIAEPLGRNTDIDLLVAGPLAGNLHTLNVAGELTTYSYDSQGRKSQETNGLGNRTTYAYDANGNETSRTVLKSVNGATVTFTTTKKYDAENRVIEETDAIGGRRTTTYNTVGKVATQTDSLGRVTAYTYDGNARLSRTDYPDGTSEQTGYDAEGNETGKTDRAGRVTRMEYDALNRLAKTNYPDGSSEATEFDAAGRVTATVDRNAKQSTLEYDAAGRQTAAVDATGRRTTQAYDENGNRTSVTVDGRTTNFEYDALNRLTKTTWPDGSTHTTLYRPDNRKQSETDPRGVTTSYGYDAAGRLTSVAQSLSATATATTTYGYDETGAKVRQVDALGRTTTWTLDGNGRITSRTIQDGATESSQYDIEGNRLAKKTFAGEQLAFQYDAQNRLTGQVVPAGAGTNSAVPQAAVSYSYSPERTTPQPARAGRHHAGRRSKLQLRRQRPPDAGAKPAGADQLYVRCAGQRHATKRGQRRDQRRHDQQPVRRSWPSQNRDGPDGKQARYTYDPAGRLTTTERDLNSANGQAQVLVTYNRYDSADRLIAVAEVKRVAGSETVLAGQALTRAAGGTITRIDTYRSGSYDPASGQFTAAASATSSFEYDGNARLTRENRTVNGNTTDTRYEYDAAGNRTKKTVTTAAGADVTTYTYDSADRLTQEDTSFAAGGSATTTYQWDGNGNLAAKIEAAKTTLYRFDPQNRLIDIRTGATPAQAQGGTHRA